MAKAVLLFLSLLLSSTAYSKGFPENTTLWVNGSRYLMYVVNTYDWLTQGTPPQQLLLDFVDPRKELESVAGHFAWGYQLFSERGTKTLSVFEIFPSPRASYLHVGTSPDVGHVTVDWLSNNVYWTDSGFGWIGMQGLREDISRMTFNARLKVVVSTSLDRPYGIVVLPQNNRLFWTDHGSPPKLESSDLLGMDRRALVWRGLVKPTALSLDHVTGRVFWVDEVKVTVESCDLEGGNRRVVISARPALLGGLQVFREFLIVADRGESQLHVYNKETGKMASTSAVDRFSPGDITVFSSALQPRDNATCDAMSCDHICIHGESCLCSSGYTLSDNGVTCTESETSLWKSFLMSNGTNICAIPVNLLFSHPYFSEDDIEDMLLCFASGVDMEHLAINSQNSTLYYASGAVIHRFHLHTASHEVYHSAASDISGLAYDWVSGKLLWSQQAPEQSIYSLTDGQSQPEVVVSGLDNPAHLALDANTGTMFWMEGSTAAGYSFWSRTIHSDGDTARILSSDLSQPRDLLYDYKTDRLYWLDVDHVGSVERDGRNKHILTISSTSQYAGLAVFRGYVAWLAKDGQVSMVFRDVDLTDPDDLVTFTLPDAMGRIADLALYDAREYSYISNGCELANGGCEQLCLVSGASHHCRCHFGFQLAQDGASCTSVYVDEPFFLVTDRAHNQIYQVDGAGQRVSAVLGEDGAWPELVTFSPGTREVVWFDRRAVAIKACLLDGSALRVVKSLLVRQNTVGALCVDGTTDNLFFTQIDDLIGLIQVINLVSLKLRTLYESTAIPRNLAIAPQKGILVFDASDGNLYSANMAMADEVTRLRAGISMFSGLALSNDGESVSWSEETEDVVWTMPLSSLIPHARLQQSGSHPRALQAQGSVLYYLTASGRTIKTLSASGTESTVADFPEFGQLVSLHYVGTEKVTSACSDRNGLCSTLCLPVSDSTRRCQCEDGIAVQPDDVKTCSNVERCSETIKDGQMSTSCLRYPGEVCTYSCSENHAPNPDSPSIRCGTSGQWNASTDWMCLLKCVGPAVTNGRLDSNCQSVAGQICKVDCDSGFSLQDQTVSPQIECTDSGTWSVPENVVCQAIDDSDDEGLPGFAIGIISAAIVLVIAIVVGVLLFRRMKRYSGRNSKPDLHAPSLPPVLLVDGVPLEGAVGGVPDKKAGDEEEVYDELDHVAEDSPRYTSFSKISPAPSPRTARRSHLPHRGELNGGLDLGYDPESEGYYDSDLGSYIDMQPDYEISDIPDQPFPHPQPHPHPTQQQYQRFLHPHSGSHLGHHRKLSNASDDYLTPI